MERVSINSVITNNPIVWNWNSVKQIATLDKRIDGHDDLFWTFQNEDLNTLYVELEILIERHLIKLKFPNKTGVSYNYKNKIYYLNLRDDINSFLALLIEMYFIVENCINHNIQLFVFNKDKIRPYCSESILSYLKTHIWISEIELYNGIFELKRKLKLETSLNESEFKKGLEYLLFLNLICYNRHVDTYAVTALGYMI